MRRFFSLYRLNEWFYHLGLILLGVVSVQKNFFFGSHTVWACIGGGCLLAYGHALAFIESEEHPRRLLRDSVLIVLPVCVVFAWALTYSFFLPMLIVVVFLFFQKIAGLKFFKKGIFAVLGHVCMFGLLFFIGAQSALSVASVNVLRPFLLGVLCALFFVPSYLLYEINNATGERFEYIEDHIEAYVKSIKLSIGFIVLFALYLWYFLDFHVTFVIGNALWGIYLVFLDRCEICDDQIHEHAVHARRTFRYIGCSAGVLYAASCVL